MDSTFAMGHVLIRRKRNVVGDEPQYVILSRCIQNMNPIYPYNTCYTGGEPVFLFVSGYVFVLFFVFFLQQLFRRVSQCVSSQTLKHVCLWNSYVFE